MHQVCLDLLFNMVVSEILLRPGLTLLLQIAYTMSPFPIVLLWFLGLAASYTGLWMSVRRGMTLFGMISMFMVVVLSANRWCCIGGHGGKETCIRCVLIFSSNWLSRIFCYDQISLCYCDLLCLRVSIAPCDMLNQESKSNSHLLDGFSYTFHKMNKDQSRGFKCKCFHSEEACTATIKILVDRSIVSSGQKGTILEYAIINAIPNGLRMSMQRLWASATPTCVSL